MPLQFPSPILISSDMLELSLQFWITCFLNTFLFCALPTCHQRWLKSLFASQPPLGPFSQPAPQHFQFTSGISSFFLPTRGGGRLGSPGVMRPCSHVLCSDHSSPAGKTSQNLWNAVIKPAQSTQSFLSRPFSDTAKYTCSRDSLKYSYENILKCTNPHILSKSHFGKKQTNKPTVFVGSFLEVEFQQNFNAES